MSSSPYISVIIPTYNRKSVLGETLAALVKQSFPFDCYEVIVVDDGSTDGTCDFISQIELPFKLKLVRQKSLGAAAARNLGVLNASGEILLFLDSDMIANKELLQLHLQSHLEYNHVLVVGRREEIIGLPNSISVIEEKTNCNDYRFKKSEFTYQEVFTCNLSLHTDDWEIIGGFDEEFPASGYEDIEFAYRAIRLGIGIFPNKHAVAFHNHRMELEQICQQTRNYQRSAALLIKKHPELRGEIDFLIDKEPIKWLDDSLLVIIRKLIRAFLALKPVLYMMELMYHLIPSTPSPSNISRSLYWKIVAGYQFIGFRDGLKEYRI